MPWTSHYFFTLTTFHNSVNSYFYTKLLNHGQVDVIFDKGPINIVARCSQEDGVEFIQMELTLHNNKLSFMEIFTHGILVAVYYCRQVELILHTIQSFLSTGSFHKIQCTWEVKIIVHPYY